VVNGQEEGGQEEEVDPTQAYYGCVDDKRRFTTVSCCFARLRTT